MLSLRLMELGQQTEWCLLMLMLSLRSPKSRELHVMLCLKLFLVCWEVLHLETCKLVVVECLDYYFTFYALLLLCGMFLRINAFFVQWCLYVTCSMCDELYPAAVYVSLQKRSRNREKRLLGTPLPRAALDNDCETGPECTLYREASR